MERLDMIMNQIQSNPRWLAMINPDGKYQSYRMDQLREQFRKVEYEKMAIERSCFKNVYRADLSDDEIAAKIQHGIDSGRLDANEGLIFARQLEEIDPTRYEVLYKPLTKWKEVLPVRPFTPGIDRVTYRKIRHTGNAVLNATGNITDIPMADADMDEYSNKVYSWTTGYHYTAKELRNAAVAGVPLQSEKVMAVELAYDRRLQTTMFLGNSQIDLLGLINYTGVTNTQAAAPVSGSDRTWPGGDKTNDEIAKDVTDAVSRIRARTYGQYGESGMIVALNQTRYDFLATTRMASGTDTTIMQFILNNSQSNGIEKFVVIHDLTGQGTGSSQLMIVYPNDPKVLQAYAAEQILWMPMENRGLNFIFNSEMEFGGLVVRYEVAMEQVYGI